MENSVFKKIGKWLLLFILVLFIGFIFACIFYIVNLIRTGQVQSQQYFTSTKPVDAKVLEAMTKDSYLLGAANPNPKVTIIEFGDFACPYCKEAFPTIREISIKYKDSVNIIFKDFPVVSANSMALAEAGRCDGEQGFFRQMYDKLYLNQDVLASESDSTKLEAELVEATKEIGADTIRFTNCFEGKKYSTQINQDLQDGDNLGVGANVGDQKGGTPTWFINGYKVVGVPPYDTFINIIEKFLK